MSLSLSPPGHPRILRGWRLPSRTWNHWTSPWTKQLTWLRIIHSGEWCLRLALCTHSGDWQKWMNGWMAASIGSEWFVALVVGRWSVWHCNVWQVDQEVTRLSADWHVWQRPQVVSVVDVRVRGYYHCSSIKNVIHGHKGFLQNKCLLLSQIARNVSLR